MKTITDSSPMSGGGCSINKRHKQHAYTANTIEINNTLYAYFNREEEDKQTKSGIDCSGLILRAAQACGIPYFCKNSSTVISTLKNLAPNEKLEEGDIIWIPGHVMIVADLKKNTLIEARHYNHDFGIVQEIPLNKSFKGIDTYDDLVHHYHHNITMERLDSSGNIRYETRSMKLLKMASTWQPNQIIMMNNTPKNIHNTAE